MAKAINNKLIYKTYFIINFRYLFCLKHILNEVKKKGQISYNKKINSQIPTPETYFKKENPKKRTIKSKRNNE
jgi:hypothetical protein